jgi:hypothetical protein
MNLHSRFSSRFFNEVISTQDYISPPILSSTFSSKVIKVSLSIREVYVDQGSQSRDSESDRFSSGRIES